MSERFGPSRLQAKYDDLLPDICQDPDWIAYWKNAGIYEAVCHTHAIEQAIVRDLNRALSTNKPLVASLVQQLVQMGHSMRSIDEYVRDGGFGPVAAYL